MTLFLINKQEEQIWPAYFAPIWEHQKMRWIWHSFSLLKYQRNHPGIDHKTKR